MENEKLDMCRHSMSHVLAKAVGMLYKNVKFAIGPSVDNGFYYDFDLSENLKMEDWPKIEEKMKTIINSNEDFVRKEVSKAEALKLFAEQPYKIELINELPENEVLSVYYLGDNWFDLCKGPHVANTKFLRGFAFALNRISGAYWRGSEKNKMLQRVYVYGFLDKNELKEYVNKIEEAKLRDHNKIGREMGIFMTDENIGQGLPLLMPKGARIIQTLQRFVEDEEERRGYVLTKTPLLAKSNLYKISGHWDHYREGMFVIGEEGKDEEVFALRPMTCPFQYTIYNNGLKSYRDLPIRYAETSTLFRNESSGEMHGLIRVRQFTISEGHIVCTPEQLEQEFKGAVDLVKFMLKTLGLAEEVSYRFSKWDPEKTDKYINEPEIWEKAQDTMKKILDHIGITYTEAKDEAAFYGPKLDIQIKNVHGKEDTIITVQVDMFLAKNFDMYYIDENSEKKRPYIIHRTSLGCYERTLALLLEKFAGALPLWICPEQVRVLTLSEEVLPYAKLVIEKLKNEGIKVVLDDDNESISKKIKFASKDKIPYSVIIGAKEAESGTLSVRKFGKGDIGSQKLEDFVNHISNLNKNRIIED